MSATGGEFLVIGPDEAPSFWQPVPANGFVRNMMATRLTGGPAAFSLGTQTVAPQCLIREHTHPEHEEIIFVLDGRGIARLEGTDHAIAPGAAVYVPRGRRHHFLNPHDQPFTFLWLMMPGGLDAFFAGIGRPRTPGEPAPEPFARPADTAEIERRTVFGWTDASYDPKA